MHKQKEMVPELERIKLNIKDSYDYFRPNYERYNSFMNFVFKSSLSDDEITLFKQLGKPQIEFNILEAFISRLRGEFARQEPTLEVMATPGAKNVNPMLIRVIEGHLRSIMFDANTDNMEWDVYTQTLGGGFSTLKVWTDYVHSMAFEQGLFVGNVYDPTLCAWDKMARKSHKGDGRFCAELFPMHREIFEEKYGAEHTKDMKFTRDLSGFNWSYSNGNQDIVLVGQYYEKKTKKVKLVRLLDGTVMPMDKYEMMKANWDRIEQVPAVIEKRDGEMVTINRKDICDCAVLKSDETDFTEFPLVFVDGNSMMIRNTLNSASEQVTRPYVYHAKGIQKLKNFSGITLANELENMVMHKWIVAKEAIPEDYADAYTDNQTPNTMVYNAFMDRDGKVPLPAPAPVIRQPAPPEIAQTFTLSDEVTKAILGNYDGQLGNGGGSDQSGEAIVQGALHSTASAMPFTVNYMKAWNQIGKIFVNLMPKYYLEPRQLAVRDVRGKSQHVQVNSPGSVSMDYPDNTLDVRIKCGPSFQVQQAKSFQMLVNLMNISPVFAQFMMQEEGLETLLDNLDIRGIDAIKDGVAKFAQQAQKEKQQAQQMQMAPIQLKQAELQQKAKNDDMRLQLDVAKVNVAQEEQATNRMEALAKIGQESDKNSLMRDKIQAQNARTAVDAITQVADKQHSHAMDVLNMHHEHRMHSENLKNEQRNSA